MVKGLIKQTHKKYEDKVQKDGSILLKPYLFLLSFTKPIYFSKEFLMLNRIKRNSRSNQQSIIFFSVHKSASTFIKNTIIKLVGANNITSINLSGYLNRKKQEQYYNNPALMKKVLKPKGYFFGAFRSFYPFPGMDKFKIILVLRDPRDVLTSYYFSTLYNHPLSSKDLYDDRKKYANYAIDDYVLEMAPGMQKSYKAYCENLLCKHNVLFLKYEDMITNFEPWLRKLNAFIGVENTEAQMKEIISSTSFKVDKEDPKSFIRNVKAGDHLRKLKPETIAELNKIFYNELKTLDYSL